MKAARLMGRRWRNHAEKTVEHQRKVDHRSWPSVHDENRETGLPRIIRAG